MYPARTLVLTSGLSFAAGSVDALCFIRLGHVFGSVMTGNVVLFGISAAAQDAGTAAHVAVSFTGYLVGVLLGSAITRRPAPGPWTGRVDAALAAELALLGGFVAGWWLTGGAPRGLGEFWLLALAGAAMGIQSAGMRALNLPTISTTYMTGVLTGAMASLLPGRRATWETAVTACAMVAGAVLAGALLRLAPGAAGVVPAAALAAVLALATAARPDTGRVD